MATQAELEFLLKMRDEASAAFRKLSDSIDKTAKGADDFNGKADNTGKKLDNLVKQAKEAATAFAGIFVLGKTSQRGIQEFSSYEKELLSIQRLTKQTDEEMQSFREAMRASEQNLSGVDPSSFRHFVELGGQLGIAKENVLEFGEVLTKLDVGLGIGNDGAVSIGRLLNATGDLKKDGVEAIASFGSALGEIQKTTKASASEIVDMSSVLQQNTAQYKLGSTTILGLAAAMTQLDLQAGSSGSTIGRAMKSLSDAALLGGESMRALTRETGITQEQLREMMNTDPSKALTTLLEAMRNIRDSGQSTTPFMESLGLTGVEDTKVLGTLSTGLDDVIKKIEAARKAAGQGSGPIDEFFGKFQNLTASYTKGLTDAFARLASDLGAALAPVYKVLVGGLTTALNAVSTAFNAVPEWGRTVLATGAIIIGAIAPVRAAFKILGGLIGPVTGGFNVFTAVIARANSVFAGLPGALNTVKTALLSIITMRGGVAGLSAAFAGLQSAFAGLANIGGVAKAFTLLRTALVAVAGAFGLLTAPVAVVVGALAVASVAVYAFWDDIREVLSWSPKEIVEAAWGKLSGAFEYVFKDLVKDVAEGIASLWDGLAEGIGSLVDKAGELWSSGMKLVFETLPSIDWGKLLSDTVDGIGNWIQGGLDAAGEAITNWWNSPLWAKPKDAKVNLDTGDAEAQAKDLHGKVKKTLEEPIKPRIEQISTGDLDILKSFVPAIQEAFDLKKQGEALDDLLTRYRALKAEAADGRLEAPGGLEITEEHIQRAQRLLEIRRQMAADPLFNTMRGLEDQLDDAAAVTVELKNQVELHRAIREAVEETGLAYDDVAERITASMQQLQQARQQTALADQFRDLDKQIALAGARTAQEEARLGILQKINDFEREHGKLGEADRASLEQRLNLLNQMQEAKRMMDQYDPVGSAQERYQAELKTLETLREQNIISAEMFNRMKGNLDRQTQASRDPVGNRIKEMREELQMMQYTGKQRQIEQTVLQEANRLKDQGVQVTDEMTQALREYATAMQQARDAEGSGLAGWAESVGTLEDNLNKLQENFADGLADAISGAISGDAGSFRKFAANLGKQMVNMAVRQLMADAIKGFGNPAKDAAMSKADAALQKLDALKDAGINAPQATVNAGTVNLNGQMPAAMGGQSNANASPLDSNYAREVNPELKALSGQATQLRAANDNLIQAQEQAAQATQTFGTSITDTVKTLPSVQGIELSAPKALELAPKNLPEVSIPEVKIPEVSLPEAKIPEMKFSEIDVPKIDVPKVDIPEVRMPDIQVPKGAMPKVEIPDMKMPEIQIPQAQMPEIKVPEIRMPELKMPKELTGDMKQAFSGLAGSGSLDIGQQVQQFNTSLQSQAQQALQVATTQLGKHEIFNRGEVNSFLKQGGQQIDAAQTAWCAGFVNSSLEQVGIKGLSGSNKYVANGFRKWGEGVNPKDVLPGDVLVKHNNKGFGTGGHVGLATGNTRMGKNGMELQMLSGNASNRVQYDWYKANQLEVRRATETMAQQQKAMNDNQIDQLQALQQQPQELTNALQNAPSPSEAFMTRPPGTEYSQQGMNFSQLQQAPQQMPQVDTQALQQSQQQMQQFNSTLQQTGQTVPQVTQPMQQLQQTSTMTTGSLQQTGTSMTSFGQQTTMASTSVQSAAPSMSMLGMNTQMAGTNAMQAGGQFQQAGTQIQAAGTQASSAGSSAGMAGGGFGGLEGALGGLMGPINQATGGLGSLASSILSFISQIGQGAGGMGGGGGFGGLFSGLFGFFAEGGEITGPGTGTSDSIMARVSNGEFVVNAKAAQANLPLLHAINDNKKLSDLPKFAKGGEIGGNSSNVVSLGIGERSLGRSGNKAASEHVAALTDQVNRLTERANAERGRGGAITNQSMNITVNARDADSFRKSEAQLMTDAGFKMQRMTKRNG